VVVHDSEGLVMDIGSDGKVRRVTEKSADTVTLLRASPDGRLLALGRASGAVVIYDTSSYQVVHESKPATKSSVHQVQFDPKNRDAAIQLDSGTIRIVALGSKRKLPWQELALRARDVAFSADGETVGILCSDGTWFYAVSDNRWTFVQDHHHTPTSGRFGPVGNQFYSADASGVVVARDSHETFEALRHPSSGRLNTVEGP